MDPRAGGPGQPDARVGSVPVARHQEVGGSRGQGSRCGCLGAVAGVQVIATATAVAAAVAAIGVNVGVGVGVGAVAPGDGYEVFEGAVQLHDHDVHVDVQEVVVRASGGDGRGGGG